MCRPQRPSSVCARFSVSNSSILNHVNSFAFCGRFLFYRITFYGVGPVNLEAMQSTIRQALPVLVAALADANVLVKDTAAWSLSR